MMLSTLGWLSSYFHSLVFTELHQFSFFLILILSWHLLHGDILNSIWQTRRFRCLHSFQNRISIKHILVRIFRLHLRFNSDKLPRFISYLYLWVRNVHLLVFQHLRVEVRRQTVSLPNISIPWHWLLPNLVQVKTLGRDAFQYKRHIRQSRIRW